MAVELPQEIIAKIIDEIAGDGPLDAVRTLNLRSCSMVSFAWHHRSQKHLFQTIWFSNRSLKIWRENVRQGEDGPSRYVAFIGLHPGFTADLTLASPSRVSPFTNLRTLHLRGLPISYKMYADCLRGLGPVVRELWLQYCQMTISQFVSFLQQFTNLERLGLRDNLIPAVGKIRHLDCGELPCLKGTLQIEIGHALGKEFAYFVHQLSVLPSALHAIAFWSCDEVPREVNELLVASRRTLTKIEFPYCEFSRPAVGSAGYSRF
jgi:hypothetical protein